MRRGEEVARPKRRQKRGIGKGRERFLSSLETVAFLMKDSDPGDVGSSYKGTCDGGDCCSQEPSRGHRSRGKNWRTPRRDIENPRGKDTKLLCRAREDRVSHRWRSHDLSLERAISETCGNPGELRRARDGSLRGDSNGGAKWSSRCQGEAATEALGRAAQNDHGTTGGMFR